MRTPNHSWFRSGCGSRAADWDLGSIAIAHSAVRVPRRTLRKASVSASGSVF